ncbi:MAG: hypothetical protein GXY32_05985 [Ruminococcaceae bacterium]|nr:hypothetical protein [Oscillospiraceae bacterium]
MTFKGNASNLTVTKFVLQGDGSYLETAATGSDYQLLAPVEGSTTGFKLVLKNVSQRFRIVYTTALDMMDNQPAFANYINTAQFNDAADGSGSSLTVRDNVSLGATTSGLKKKGNKEGDDFRWKITINDNSPLLTINPGSVLTDILGRGQVLKEGSITVTNLATNMPLVMGPGQDYTLDVLPRDPETLTTTFTITFPKQITTKVEVSYLSILDPDTAQLDPADPSKMLVTNSARFVGNGTSSWSYENQTTVAVSGAGTGAGTTIPMRIEKYSRDGSIIAVLDGAQFTLRSANGSYTKTGITTLDGKSAQIELLAGTYIIEETLVPDGYDKAPDQTITLNASTAREGGVVVIKFYNEPTPPTPPPPDPDPTYSLVVLKQDADTGAALAGAQFEVLNSAGISQGTILIGADGAGALATQLPAGTYTVVEAVAPEGYALPANPNTTVQVPGTNAQNNVVTVTITNQKPVIPPDPDPDPDPDPTYTLTILKRDADTGAALSGAQFIVRDSGGAYKGLITIDSKGKGSLAKKLPAGTYTVTEAVAPTGYQLPEKATTVKLPGANEKNGVVTITITNQKVPVTPSGDPEPPDTPETPAPPARPVAPPETPDPEPPVDDTPEAVIVPNTPATVQPTGGGAAPAEPEDPTPAPVAQEEGPEGIAQDFMNIPLGGLGVSLAWSLLNLIMSILSLLAAIVLIVSMVRRKKTNPADPDDNEAQLAQDDELEEEADEKPLRTRRLGLRLLAILTGFIPGVLFLILENIRLPMTWITRWTPIIGLFFIINMAALLIHFIITKRAAKNKPEDHDDDVAAPNFA